MPPSEDVRHGRKAHLASTNDSGLLEAAQRFYKKTYAGDYLGLALVCAALLLIKFFGEPFHQMFMLNDPRLQHPHAEVQRVSVCTSTYIKTERERDYLELIHNANVLAQLFLYAAGIPLIVLILWTLTWRPDFHKAHITILGLAISLLTTTFLTDVLKDAIGRPRPDLIARCKPNSSAPHDRHVTIDICTETHHHTLHDGWRSFPSGHSSVAFAGLTWLALFLASQTHLLRPRASLITVLLCLAPLLGAALIAISRLEDYRHDIGDVICGSALGFVVAYFNWRRYYPSLLSKGCDEPFAAPEGSPSGGAFSEGER